MNDDELLAGFESCTLPSGSFHHADHVKVVWLYLQTEPVLSALGRFSAALKRFAAAAGRPNLYHETITCAYVFLVNERLARTDPGASWEEFARLNGDLLTWRPSLLDRLYRNGTLDSDLARRVFVLPDHLAALAVSTACRSVALETPTPA